MLSGVPQGSILDPFLVIIYANDIPDVISHSKLFLYANDTKILTAVKLPSNSLELQEDLTVLGFWWDQWILSFNTSKCTVTIFSKNKEKVDFDYSLHGSMLDSKLQYRIWVSSFHVTYHGPNNIRRCKYGLQNP